MILLSAEVSAFGRALACSLSWRRPRLSTKGERAPVTLAAASSRGPVCARFGFVRLLDSADVALMGIEVSKVRITLGLNGMGLISQETLPSVAARARLRNAPDAGSFDPAATQEAPPNTRCQ